MSLHRVVISGTGLFSPDEVIENTELVETYNRYVEQFNMTNADAIAAGDIEALAASSPEFIKKASGIERRRVLDKAGILDTQRMKPRLENRDNDTLSQQAEMAVIAAKQALDAAKRNGGDVDMILVACSNMQRAYPAMAIEVQQALEAKGYAYDLNVACSSATFGLQAAVAALQTGQARCALIVNPEICSAHLNFRNRDCHFIFGDACTAMVLERLDDCQVERPFEVLDTQLMTEFSNNIRNNAGFLNTTEVPARDEDDRLFQQNGRSVFKEVVPAVVKLIAQQLENQQLSSEQIQRFWLHQANANMNVLIAKKLLGRPATPEEAPLILDDYANTSSAGCVIAFHQYSDDLPSGALGILCSFGAGYSIGSALVRRL